MNWVEFFNMGGYAFHVWTSWALSIGALITIVIVAKLNNAKIKKDLERQIRREAKLQQEKQ